MEETIAKALLSQEAGDVACSGTSLPELAKSLASTVASALRAEASKGLTEEKIREWVAGSRRENWGTSPQPKSVLPEDVAYHRQIIESALAEITPKTGINFDNVLGFLRGRNVADWVLRYVREAFESGGAEDVSALRNAAERTEAALRAEIKEAKRQRDEARREAVENREAVDIGRDSVSNLKRQCENAYRERDEALRERDRQRSRAIQAESASVEKGAHIAALTKDRHRARLQAREALDTVKLATQQTDRAIRERDEARREAAEAKRAAVDPVLPDADILREIDDVIRHAPRDYLNPRKMFRPVSLAVLERLRELRAFPERFRGPAAAPGESVTLGYVTTPVSVTPQSNDGQTGTGTLEPLHATPFCAARHILNRSRSPYLLWRVVAIKEGVR